MSRESINLNISFSALQAPRLYVVGVKVGVITVDSSNKSN